MRRRNEYSQTEVFRWIRSIFAASMIAVALGLATIPAEAQSAKVLVKLKNPHKTEVPPPDLTYKPNETGIAVNLLQDTSIKLPGKLETGKNTTANLVLLETGSTVQIDKATRVTLNKANNYVVHEGSIVLDTKGNPSMVITPKGRFRAKKTIYWVAVAPDNTTTATVIEGTVEVSDIVSDDPQLHKRILESGDQITIGKTVTVTALTGDALTIPWASALERVDVWRERTWTRKTRNSAELQIELDALTKKVKDAPNDPDTQRALGDVLYDLGRFSEAQKAYEAANRLRPNDEDTLLRLGYLFLELGDHMEAEGYFNLILSPRANPGTSPLNSMK